MTQPMTGKAWDAWLNWLQNDEADYLLWALASPDELEDAEFVSATDLDDDMFPEWDAAAELADDVRRGR